jgi:hypothetical protein
MKQAEVRWFDLDVLDLREGIVVFPFRIAGLNQEAHVSSGSSYQIDSEIANSMMTLVGNSCWRSDFAGHLVEDEANHLTSDDASKLIDHVFGKPVSDPEQETGSVILSLAALANARDINMLHAGEKELDRVWDIFPRIRAKHRNAVKGSPLPGAITKDA